MGHHRPDILGDPEQHELALSCRKFPVQHQQQAQAGAGQIIYIRKVQDQLRIRRRETAATVPVPRVQSCRPDSLPAGL